MIEGINPSAASVTRAPGAATQDATFVASNQSLLSNSPPEVASFSSTSLVTSLDPNLNAAIRQIQDNQTGDIIRTIPSDAQIEAYQRSLNGSSVAASFVPLTFRDEVIAAQASADIEVETTQEDRGSTQIQTISPEPTTNVAQSVDIEVSGTSSVAAPTQAVSSADPSTAALAASATSAPSSGPATVNISV